MLLSFLYIQPSRTSCYHLSLLSRENVLTFALVAERLLHPKSKLSRHCLEGTRLSCLAQVLGVEGATEGRVLKGH